MSEKKPIYITTTLPYVNASPHIGFAMELLRVDALVRYFHLMGHPVFFNTGTDEHGMKIYENALAAGQGPQAYVDGYAAQFKDLVQLLGLHESVHFVRTTDQQHIAAAEEMWRRCDAAGYIYKKNYQAKYCVGCELEKTDGELVDGQCPIHPTREIEFIEEENYFFRFSALADQLEKYYTDNPDFVRPDFRFNEIKSFVDSGLQDFSISRLSSKMPWGVPVPGDADHVMYVWFDALTNYISTLGWPEDESGDFATYWEKGFTIQYAGQDNLRQQSAIWQAMLMAAGLPPTDQIIINGFIVGEGNIKMSKSIGNVISPMDIIDKYGREALRYYLLRHVEQERGSPVSLDLIHDMYTAHLVNGIGNLTSRIMKMAEDHLGQTPEIPAESLPEEWISAMASFEITKACDIAWREVSDLDEYIATTKPFQVVKEDKAVAQNIISELVVRLYTLARMLQPIMPETSDAIKALVKANKKPTTPLFPRVENV